MFTAASAQDSVSCCCRGRGRLNRRRVNLVRARAPSLLPSSSFSSFQVVVMRPKGSARVPHSLLVGVAEHGITIRTVERENADYMDWCEAPVESEWFM